MKNRLGDSFFIGMHLLDKNFRDLKSEGTNSLRKTQWYETILQNFFAKVNGFMIFIALYTDNYDEL